MFGFLPMAKSFLRSVGSYFLRPLNTVRNGIGRRLVFMDFVYNGFKLY